MQAVILAAGKGTRMGSLTAETPKPMLNVGNKPVLEHILDALPDEVDEVILIIGYLGHVIHDHFGGAYNGKRVLYVEQEELNGTGGALWRAQELLKERFLVMNGDDICAREDMRACAESPDWAMLVQKVEDIGSAGKVVVKNGHVMDIVEKEVHGGTGPGLANAANFFLLDMRVFSYPPVYRPGSTTEFGLPQTIVQAAKDIPIHAIEAHSLVRLTSHEDIAAAEKALGYRL